LEQKALQFFQNNPQSTEYSYIDEETQEIRYFRPVRLAKQCELCHGDPATSSELWGNYTGSDILGYRMENKRAGDLHGAFEIITPLNRVNEQLRTHVLYAIGFTVITLIVIGAAGYIS